MEKAQLVILIVTMYLGMGIIGNIIVRQLIKIGDKLDRIAHLILEQNNE